MSYNVTNSQYFKLDLKRDKMRFKANKTADYIPAEFNYMIIKIKAKKNRKLTTEE